MAQVKNINVEIIPHDKQRYPTVGDYWVDADNVLQVRISDLGNPQYHMLVLIHELVEWTLCESIGITEAAITAFDISYEHARPEGNVSEPGDSPDAPYHFQHKFATHIERTFAKQLGVDWEKYEETVNAL